MTDLEIFLTQLPFTKVIASDGELRYRLRLPSVGKFYEKKAKEIIADYNLALEANLETWSHGDIVFEVVLVVREVVTEEQNIFSI